MSIAMGSNMPLIGAIAGAGQYAESNELYGQGGLSIRIVPANGGIIVSIRDENNNMGRNSDLHVIHQDADIGTELGKLITLHYLKKA